MAEKWERLPDETPQAYKAFKTYLDLGEGRTIRDAYRQLSGKPKAIQAGGTWNLWAKKHSWDARARAFDVFQVRRRTEGAGRVAEQSGIDWQKRREAQLVRDFDVAQNFMRKAEIWSNMPASRQVVQQDGTTVIVEAVGIRDTKWASDVAHAASALAWAAIGEALREDMDDFDPETATIADLKAILERAGRARRNRVKTQG